MVRGQQHSGWLKNRRKESGTQKNLFKILSATELLQEKKYQHFLQELPKLSGLGEQEYNGYYLKTIFNFAEFAQLLPHTAISYFSYAGGFLDHGLERCYRALKHCRTYFATVENAQESLTPQQLLWIYAIFSASLLLDIGKLCAKIQVTLCNTKGAALQNWLPYAGPMTQQKPATHYQYEFIPENLRRLKNLTNSLFARQLLPISGFNWLAGDKAILEAWLAILAEDHTGGTIMPMIIPLADAQAIESYWATYHLGESALPTEESLPQFFMPGGDAFAMTPFNTQDSNVTPGATLDAADAFLAWLRNGIEKDKISMNKADSLIHRIADGRFVILPQAFGEFAKQNSQFKDAAEVARQFNMMEITGENVSFRQFKDAQTKIVKGAFVLNNPFILMSGNKDLPQTSSYLERIGIITPQAIQNWFKPTAAPITIVEPPKAVK